MCSENIHCRLRSLRIWLGIIYFSIFASIFRSSNAFVLKNNGPSSEIYVTTPVVACGTATRLQQRSTRDVDDATSKGIVSLLTNVVNSAFDTWSILFSRNTSPQTFDGTRTSSFRNLHESIVVLQQQQQRQQPSPSSPLELLERIRNDYTERNYLWTGDLDVEANFDKMCRFTDPTLSFVGTDTYLKNIQNLRPILNLVVTNVALECRSELMDIQLYDTYIQTRWNMIGTLSRLPWTPKIDVIGQTKFWYHNDTNQIYFYDEIWEIPANQALLQLLTPTTYKNP